MFNAAPGPRSEEDKTKEEHEQVMFKDSKVKISESLATVLTKEILARKLEDHLSELENGKVPGSTILPINYLRIWDQNRVDWPILGKRFLWIMLSF